MINDKGANTKRLGEQWKLTGNCDLCRRKNYCRKRCKKANERSSKILSSAVHAAMVDTIHRTDATADDFHNKMDDLLEDAKDKKWY